MVQLLTEKSGLYYIYYKVLLVLSDVTITILEPSVFL